MTNTTLEAINIKTALSFRPGRCTETNLYYKRLYLTVELRDKNKINRTDFQSVAVTNHILCFCCKSQPLRFAYRILFHRDFEFD
jgi:hypothetical protein